MKHTIIQVRLPASNMEESVRWYEAFFGFETIWKTEDEADLKLEPGPYLFLKRTNRPVSIAFEHDGRAYSVISIRTSDIEACRKRLMDAGVQVTEIIRTWDIDRLQEFDAIDPAGNRINIGSYPDVDPSQT
jgi:catechol 2,3-dioxygenase-like lactoylglutathione lyase family enzyme